MVAQFKRTKCQNSIHQIDEVLNWCKWDCIVCVALKAFIWCEAFRCVSTEMPKQTFDTANSRFCLYMKIKSNNGYPSKWVHFGCSHIHKPTHSHIASHQTYTYIESIALTMAPVVVDFHDIFIGVYEVYSFHFISPISFFCSSIILPSVGMWNEFRRIHKIGSAHNVTTITLLYQMLRR